MQGYDTIKMTIKLALLTGIFYKKIFSEKLKKNNFRLIEMHYYIFFILLERICMEN